MNPLILIDGSSYLFRAYHALPPLTNADGLPTGAIYGVLNMLGRLQKDYRPERLAVVFDPPGKTFRHDLYPQYKANRAETPEDLAAQIPPLYEAIRALGLPLIVVKGMEADDVIGTLARREAEQGRSVIISTGDKDMTQLVNDRITLLDTMKGKSLDRDGVREKFGVAPEQMIDYLSLTGDSVDNVPGVPGVGPKTAVKWLDQYGSLDKLAQNAEAIGGKVGDNFRRWLQEDRLPLTRRLIVIRQDVPLPVEAERLEPQPPERAKLIKLFTRLNFKSWLKEQRDNGGQTANNTPASDTAFTAAQTISDMPTLEAYIETLQTAKLFAFDTETTDLNDRQARLVGLSFALDGESGVYIPVGHDYIGAPKQLPLKKVLAKLKPILQNSKIKKVGQNLKYDSKVLLNYDIKLQGIAFDTMLESYVLHSPAASHGLDALALKYLGHHCIAYETLCGKGAKQINFSQAPIEQAAPYAVEDAAICMRLHQHLWPQLQGEAKLQNIFGDIEMPLLSVLARMERRGVLIDAAALRRQSRELGKRLEKLQEQAYQTADCVFNLNSPKQLQEVLFDKMQLPILKKTPKGQPSTSEAALQDLARDFELPRLILAYRSLSKLQSTYLDRLPEQIDTDTGRVHTSYHQAVVSTGRLSSVNPNLQNIPIKSEAGRRIREAFVAPEGYQLIAADYSQIELRIMAHLSGDASLKKAFAEEQDIHAATAAQIFAVPPETVNAAQRRKAKAINFGLIYGMSAFGLAKQIGAERTVAQHYIDTYFRRYPGVKRYMDDTRRLAHEQGYVETLLGRRLYLDEIHSKNKMRRMAAERIAINAPMQGTAADMIKLAMLGVDRWLTHSDIDAHMVMQVHDELVLEVPTEEVPRISAQVADIMQNALPLDVPVTVDIGYGDNWHEAH